jgi:hypothetical protein
MVMPRSRSMSIESSTWASISRSVGQALPDVGSVADVDDAVGQRARFAVVDVWQ